MPEQSTSTQIVIMESGAEWPGWFGQVEGATAQTRVIAQHEAETVAAFCDRVEAEVQAARSSGPVGTGIVACSERLDDSAEGARRRIARVLLAAMDPDSGGQVLFTESQRKSGGSRQALSSLATDLSHEWHDRGLSVSVRFGQPSYPPQSSLEANGALSNRYM